MNQTTLYTQDGTVPAEVLKEDWFLGAKRLTVKIGNATYNAHYVSSSLAWGPHWVLDRMLTESECLEMIALADPCEYLNDYKNYVVADA